jgi:glutamyl-tRNA(Gln) amidotransferase subunit E
MYPDTDLPPTRIDEARVQSIRERMPEAPWVREERYRWHGLPEDVLLRLLVSPYASAFDRIVNSGADPKLAAVTLTRTLTALRRSKCEVANLSPERIEEVFDLLVRGAFQRELVAQVLRWAAARPDAPVEGILAAEGISPCEEAEVERHVEEAFSEPPRTAFRRKNRDILVRCYAGRIMRDLRGRVCAADAISRIESRLEKMWID